ncbi:transglutaminase superfamily protein [Kineococcus xinjiangensis]|uniref:Transglutaminase superfamily protein n=1 Tax=Kineococcus xinjiangensis TaxID=512762 RepID=A0A2S6IJY2_9ACTN|nr:transglutaminase superfamily protein [Kineococcus xinjiangensis]
MLRGCALVTLLCGPWAFAATGVLPVWAALLAAAVQVAAAASCLLAASPAGVRTRQRAAWVLLALCCLLTWWLAGSGGNPPTGLPGLPLLVLGGGASCAAAATTARHLRAQLLLGTSATVLAAGLQPGPALAPVLVVTWLALTVGLVRAHAPALSAAAVAFPVRPGDGADPAQRRPARAGTPVLTATALALALLLLVPVPSGGGALEALAERLAGTESAAATGPGSGGQRRAAAYAGGRMDLNSRGALGDEPLLAVPADSPAWWRSGVLDTYDGRGWTASRPSTSWYADAQGYVAVDADVPQAAAERTDQVVTLGDYPAAVFPGFPRAARVDSPVGVDGSALLLVAGTAGSYTVVATEVPGSGARPGSEPGAAAHPADTASALHLPPELPQRVHDLAARLAAGAPDRWAHVRAVEEHLRATARYTLDAPVPAPGQDAVDAFLFDQRLGFCEHFASAEVVLLRSAGVPARIVTGFAGGETRDDGRRVLRARDAHAWVEVWIPGQGWTTSDPTAGSTAAPATAWAAAGSWLRQLPPDGWPLPAGVALAVAAGLLLRRRRRPGRPIGPPAPAAAPTALLAALADLDAALAPHRAARGPAEDLRTFGWRLRALGEPAAAEAVAVAERACYAPAPPAAAETAAARAALAAAAARWRSAGARVPTPTRAGGGAPGPR